MGTMQDEEKKGSDTIPPPSASNRRSHDRIDVSQTSVNATWAVDCAADETFLFASIANISEMGIFVRTMEPLAVGTQLLLTFSPPPSIYTTSSAPFKLDGVVAWVNRLRANGDNPNPGMGVRFIALKLDDRERLVDVIRTIAYVREPS